MKTKRDGHVIIGSGCLILRSVNLIILIRMGNINDKLVSSCARSIVTFAISLHEVCVRLNEVAYMKCGRTLHSVQTSEICKS